ncbi:hypothetical protein [Halothermothrix orenii]|uniref:Extracellular solute-binding protein family 1 n=1 Tax=Halothermothrix orenii (strain H 168 / OCM 544 / DSM 9562) TaxID=373903 RepID=B8D0J9_HALOH|nr:hypothetical protein [Halothermothrix orenii]ACL70935.1 hypothetical protein Hore_21890 [Halothermothrix orenii H 168]
MKRFAIWFLVLVVLAAAVSAVHKIYDLRYLYRIYIKREFAINPKAEIRPDRVYKVRIWYYPYKRVITKEGKDEKEFFKEVAKEVERKYPNIQLKIGRLDFRKGRATLDRALKAGDPPDIYFNFSNQPYITKKLQVPAHLYLTREDYELLPPFMEEGRLWGFPFLIERQVWLARNNLPGLAEPVLTINRFDDLKDDSLILNYYDPTLLLQLLSLYGISDIEYNGKTLDNKTLEALRAVFKLAHNLRQAKIYGKAGQVDITMLKSFFQGKTVLLGPVNPWLKEVLSNRLSDSIVEVKLDNLVRVYTLTIFRQEPYRGDDHTKAAVEVARIIAQKKAYIMASDLGLIPAFRMKKEVEQSGDISIDRYKPVITLTPEERDYWYKNIIPLWVQFWEDNLSPEEALATIIKNN